MTPVLGHAGFSSPFVPTLAGTGIALKAGFIGKPDVYIGLLH
jgi:hypothetical protein